VALFVYRIVLSKARTADLSGTGAYRYGGRWNSKGTYLLYTSESSSLAMLESLVHFEPQEFPSELYLIRLKLSDRVSLYSLPEKDYPSNWRQPGSTACASIGDAFVQKKRHWGMRVRSAVNPEDFNILLNPAMSGWQQSIRVESVSQIEVDWRLGKTVK
jgi:RES domain-containing protein